MWLQIFAVHNAILVGVLIFSIALWIYFGNRNRASNITMSALLIAVAFWSFAHVLWRAAEHPEQMLFWLRSLVFISTLLPVLFLLHVISLYKSRMAAASVQAAVFMPNLITFWFIFGTSSVVSVNVDGAPEFGGGGFVLGLYFGVVYLFALLILLFASRMRRGIKRKTLIATFIGSVLAFNTVFGVLVTLSTYHDLRAFWIANAALAIGMLVIALPTVGQSMIRDLRLIGGELFILLTITLVVTDVVISESLLDFSFRLVLLVVIVFYGVLILRSMVRDVHRLRQVEKLGKKLSRVNRELVASDKMKTRFLSFASHQLRSPLSGVMSYLSMLRDGDFGRVSVKQKDVLEMNIDAMERLRDTIETFLDVSKIEMGGLELTEVDTKIEMLVADIVKEKSIIADKKGLKIELDVNKKMPSVMADSGKLYHAIANILDNALKYTEKGKVKVRVEPVDNKVQITVMDTGKGMEKGTLGRVRRVMEHGLEEIHFDKEGGSGLGIHIASKIVEGHGGKISVSSPGKGEGSKFVVQLPVS